MMKSTVAFVLAIIIAGGRASAAELGDPAPAINIAKWVKGDGVQIEKSLGKAVQVIEFWATWCPACRQAIPRLTELQEEYNDRGVSVVGITNEEPKTVQAFVAKMGEKMDYAVAIDNEDKTAAAYLEAFGIDYIPYAFIVDRDGRIVWGGNPLDGDLKTTLAAVVAGRHDLGLAKREQTAEKLLAAYVYLATETEDSDLTRLVGERISEHAQNDEETLEQLAWAIVTAEGIKKRDLALALRAAQRAHEITEGNNGSVLDTYARVLYEMGRTAEAVKFQKRAVELSADNDDYRERLKHYEQKLTEREVERNPQGWEAEFMPQGQVGAHAVFTLTLQT